MVKDTKDLLRLLCMLTRVIFQLKYDHEKHCWILILTRTSVNVLMSCSTKTVRYSWRKCVWILSKHMLTTHLLISGQTRFWGSLSSSRTVTIHLLTLIGSLVRQLCQSKTMILRPFQVSLRFTHTTFLTRSYYLCPHISVSNSTCLKFSLILRHWRQTSLIEAL